MRPADWIGLFSMTEVALMIAGAFVIGLVLGRQLEARRWRAKGDAGLTRMESAGKLYRVERERPEITVMTTRP